MKGIHSEGGSAVAAAQKAPIGCILAVEVEAELSIFLPSTSEEQWVEQWVK